MDFPNDPHQYDPDHGRVVLADNFPASQLSAEAFLGGRRHGACQIVLTIEQAKALLAGSTLAADVREEYVLWLTVEPARHRAP